MVWKKVRKHIVISYRTILLKKYHTVPYCQPWQEHTQVLHISTTKTLNIQLINGAVSVIFAGNNNYT